MPEQLPKLYVALQPPAAPKKPFNFSPLTQTLISIMVLISVLVIFLMILSPILFIRYLAIDFPIDTPSTYQFDSFGPDFSGIIIFICIALFLVVSVFAIREYFKFQKANLTDEQKYKQSYLLWQTYQQRWEKLCYCHTDGIVFLPGKNLSVPPQHLQSFIKEHKYFAE
jgi:hypothetical protein